VLRVALIDGDSAIRAGRKMMIEAQENLLLVFEESDGPVALEKIPELLVDVLVIDQRLNGCDGLQLACNLVDAYSEKQELCPTIILTGSYATPELVLAAIRNGASDVVTQDSPMADLLLSINNANNRQQLPDFSAFDEVLDHADYKPLPNPTFVLRRSQLSPNQEEFLVTLDRTKSLAKTQFELQLTGLEFQGLLNDLLLSLHFATPEQLYLALHDSKSF